MLWHVCYSLQGDGDSILNFNRSFLDDVRGQEIQSPKDVFLSILVEHTPCATLGHVPDFRKVIEVWYRGWIRRHNRGVLLSVLGRLSGSPCLFLC